MENDRVYLYHGGRRTMVVVRTGRHEEWAISASYARLVARDMLRAADEADARNAALPAPAKEET